MRAMDDENLNKWILKKYPNFKFKYYLTTDHPEIARYLKELMYYSFMNSSAKQQNDPSEKSKQEQFRRELPEIIHMVEDFFVAGEKTGLFHDGNRLKILNSMKKACKYIEFLPKGYDGVYGVTRRSNKCIQINNNMAVYSGRRTLTPEEVRRLYLFHELGHTILNISNNPMMQQFYDTYSNVMNQKGKPDRKPLVPELVATGFLMIEDCLTQEMAEKFTYCLAGKRRPKYFLIRDMETAVESNLDYYNIFQRPTIDLGRTMRGCGSEENTSNEAVLEGMLKRSLDHDFMAELISEYDLVDNGSPDAYKDLMDILYEMGIICDKKYSIFGHGLVSTPYVGTASQALSKIHKITEKYVDFRDYPEDGFPDMNFTHPTIQHSQVPKETAASPVLQAHLDESERQEQRVENNQDSEEMSDSQILQELSKIAKKQDRRRQVPKEKIESQKRQKVLKRIDGQKQRVKELKEEKISLLSRLLGRNKEE